MSTSFPLDGMRVRFSGDTNVGMKRTHNEDSFHLPVDERLAIVADGMGGHASGEVASLMAVETVVEYFRATAEELKAKGITDFQLHYAVETLQRTSAPGLLASRKP